MTKSGRIIRVSLTARLSEMWMGVYKSIADGFAVFDLGCLMGRKYHRVKHKIEIPNGNAKNISFLLLEIYHLDKISPMAYAV